jgi:prepilin-type processing-associated H-X9-DG protein
MQNAQDTTPGTKYPGGSDYSLWIMAGLLYPYINNINVYHCPADQTVVPRGGGAFSAPALRTYSMNCWVQPMDAPGNSTATWEGITGYNVYTKLPNMANPGPSKIFVFIEESPYCIDDGFFAVDPRPANGTTWYNSPAVLHGRSSQLAYADGHSEPRRWTDGSMISELPSSPSGNTDNWPASKPYADLQWLISVSTAPMN